MNFIYSKKSDRKYIINLNVYYIKDITDYKMDESSALWYKGFTIYWKPLMNQE